MSSKPDQASSSAAPPPSLLQRAWAGWKKLAHVIGVFNTRVIMSLFYFVIILPVGLVFRLFNDPLQLKEPPQSNWVPLPPQEHDLGAAHNQF